MEKSRDAFRTISEVAEWLDVPTHVLRFWESRFAQIKPVKRAGGRRYYRPSDMRIIGGVKVLLHDQGLTIRGVQKLFREKGIKHVAAFAPDLFTMDGELIEASAAETETSIPVPPAEPAPPEPAFAARTTHEAAPLSASEPSADAEPETSSRDLFSTVREPQVAAAEIEPRKEPVKTAPPEPDLPETDPEDEDPDFERAAGIAARLALSGREHLSQHRDTLTAAHARLTALRERMS